MAKQIFISSFCELTGISKRSLAQFLNADQSLLTKIDSGQRNLPGHALPVLSGLYKQAATVTNMVAAQPSAEEKMAAKEQAMWCIAQCHPLKKKLTAMQVKYRQATAAILVLDTYQKENSPLPKKKQRWIDEQRYQAQRRQRANGWMQQRKLSVGIDLLQQEAKLWKEVERG